MKIIIIFLIFININVLWGQNVTFDESIHPLGTMEIEAVEKKIYFENNEPLLLKKNFKIYKSTTMHIEINNMKIKIDVCGKNEKDINIILKIISLCAYIIDSLYNNYKQEIYKIYNIMGGKE